MSGTPNQQQRYGCYIGNIDRSVHLEMLKQLFSQCGTILDCSLNGRDEDPYRYGFIDFATEEDRARAMRFNGFVLNERRLKVNVSRGNVNRPDGTTGKRPNNGMMQDRNIQHMSNNDNGQQNSMQGLGGSTPPPNMPNGISPSQVDILLQMLQNAQQGGGAPQPPQPQQQPPPPPQPGMPNAMPYGMAGMGSAGGLGPVGSAAQGAGAGGMAPAPGGADMGGYPPLGGVGPGGPMGMPPMGPPGGMGFPPMGPWGMPPHGPMRMPPPGMMPPMPMGYPPMGPPMPGMGGHRGMPFGRGPANPPPTPEMLKQREKQRAEFYDVIRKDAEKYEKKMAERRQKDKEKGDGAAAGGKSSDDDESSDDERETKKAKKESTSADTS